MRQFSKSIRTVAQRLTLAGLIGVVNLIGIANAQTEYTISSSTPNLESEYRAELDKWMLRAYEGDRDAQFKVGVLFANKQFNEPDFEQAVYWYKQAARQEHVLAQYNLGHQYLTGVGVKANTETAMQWWLKAATNNHPLAQFNIGRAYYLGIGLQEDHDKARKWFTSAANNQEPKSIDILEQLGWAEPGEFAKTPDVSNSLVASDSPETNIANEQSNIVITESSLSNDENTPPESELVSRITPANSPAEQTSSELINQETINQETIEQAAINIDDTGIANNKQTTASTTEAADTPEEAAGSPNVNQADIVESNSTQQTPNNTDSTSKSPIALYTDPNIRSVLITIINDKNDLEILKVGRKWVRVRLERGFPVWVHEDYIITADNIGTITGSTVNARSVPIVTNGTIVGKLKKNESVEIVDKNNDWYRIVSPSRFKAWVKANDIKRLPYNSGLTSASNPDSNLKPTERIVDTVNPAPNGSLSIGSLGHDEWLYSQASDSFTLQLASFNEPEKIAEFITRDKFINNSDLHRFTSKGKNDITWTYFLYGQYKNTESAKAARSKIKQKRAWIRSFGKLQQNRCVAWKRQLPPPKELNKYCVN